MDSPSYNKAVAAFFSKLVRSADEIDPDVLECDATADMVTLSSPRGAGKVIVNTQRAVSQIWVAGKGIGVHFSLSADARWLDDRNQGLELGDWINQCVLDLCGARLVL